MAEQLMNEPQQIAEQFVAALAANDESTYQTLLADDVFMRAWRWDGGEAYRPRARVVRRLQSEWRGWPDPTIELLSVTGDGDRLAVEFRIQTTEAKRYVEHNRVAVLTLSAGRIDGIDLYCSQPLPSARRKGWIAPADLSDMELRQLFDSFDYTFDIREWVPPLLNGRISLNLVGGGTENEHPGSNSVAGARWTAEEADRRIAETIAYYGQRNCGFQWFVGPYDTPSDLRERLERHGLVLAGDQALMVLRGLDNLQIPTNPQVEVEEIDGTNDEAIEAALQIAGVCFNWTPEQIDERRPGYFEVARNPELRRDGVAYLAKLNGTPVANARLIFRGGLAYLGGAATLPAYRSQKVYSTLLRRRLEVARDRGYQMAAIHAEPMSRRVVARYGFTEYARFYLYAWMPVMDLAVIRSLVPDD